MNSESDRAALAYAHFDLWITQQLEQLVTRWISLAAPCDARHTNSSLPERRTTLGTAWRPQRERD